MQEMFAEPTEAEELFLSGTVEISWMLLRKIGSSNFILILNLEVEGTVELLPPQETSRKAMERKATMRSNPTTSREKRRVILIKRVDVYSIF